MPWDRTPEEQLNAQKMSETSPLHLKHISVDCIDNHTLLCAEPRIYSSLVVTSSVSKTRSVNNAVSLLLWQSPLLAVVVTYRFSLTLVLTVSQTEMQEQL